MAPQPPPSAADIADLDLVLCDLCARPLLRTALPRHLARCAPERPKKFRIRARASTLPLPPFLAALAPTLLSDPPPPRRSAIPASLPPSTTTAATVSLARDLVPGAVEDDQDDNDDTRSTLTNGKNNTGNNDNFGDNDDDDDLLGGDLDHILLLDNASSSRTSLDTERVSLAPSESLQSPPPPTSAAMPAPAVKQVRKRKPKTAATTAASASGPGEEATTGPPPKRAKTASGTTAGSSSPKPGNPTTAGTGSASSSLNNVAVTLTNGAGSTSSLATGAGAIASSTSAADGLALDPSSLAAASAAGGSTKAGSLLGTAGKLDKNAPLDLDRNCGVEMDDGGLCRRSITCKKHSMLLKRSVKGRSQPYDTLLALHRGNMEREKKEAQNREQIIVEQLLPLPLLDYEREAAAITDAVKRLAPPPMARPTPMYHAARPMHSAIEQIRAALVAAGYTSAQAAGPPGSGMVVGGGATVVSVGGGGSASALSTRWNPRGTPGL